MSRANCYVPCCLGGYLINQREYSMCLSLEDIKNNNNDDKSRIIIIIMSCLFTGMQGVFSKFRWLLTLLQD